MLRASEINSGIAVMADLPDRRAMTRPLASATNAVGIDLMLGSAASAISMIDTGIPAPCTAATA